MRLATPFVVLAAVATSCGGSDAPAPTVKLALKGQLSRAAPGTQATPVRLAMAWYPAFGGTTPASPAAAVVPQERVTFEGSFPIRFSFEVAGPPPARALYDLANAGGAGRIGYGVLLAYLDRNGNGTFDPIPRGGSPVDTVVGTSVPDPSLPPPEHSYFVVYLAGTPAPGDYWAGFSLQQEYNLLRINSNFGVERVPLDSDVTVPLTFTPALDLYACPDIFVAEGFMQTACGIDPYGGRYQAQGSIFATPTGTRLAVNVYDGRGNVADAALAVDGSAASYDAVGQSYFWISAATLAGAHTLTIAVPGHEVETLPFTIPEPFAVTAPTPGATLARGGAVSIAWGASTGTAYYDIYFLADDATGSWLFHALPAETSVATPPIAYSGPAHVTVKAIGPMGVGSQGSFLTPIAQVSTDVVFVP